MYEDGYAREARWASMAEAYFVITKIVARQPYNKNTQ
jgi:hypothetical protein